MSTARPWRILSVQGDSVRVAWRGGLTLDVRVELGQMVKPREVYVVPRHHAALVESVMQAWNEKRSEQRCETFL